MYTYTHHAAQGRAGAGSGRGSAVKHRRARGGGGTFVLARRWNLTTAMDVLCFNKVLPFLRDFPLQGIPLLRKQDAHCLGPCISL